MIKVIQTDDNGYPVAFSELLKLEKHIEDNLNCHVVDNFDNYKNKKWVNGQWLDVIGEKPDILLISLADFYDKFTDTELGNIFDAAKASGAIEAYVKKLESRVQTGINIKSGRLLAGLLQMEKLNLLAAGRANEIISS